MAVTVVSQNGYPANQINLTQVWTIPGTSRSIRLKKGDAGWLLCHFAAWFDKNIESIDNDGELDDWGYAERNVRGSDTVVSNHASGTAIDLNAPEHWLGERGTFTPEQTAKIRDRLRIYNGCIRWGGDYVNRADEMHFEINRPLADVSEVAHRLRTQGDDMSYSQWSDADKQAFLADIRAALLDGVVDSITAAGGKRKVRGILTSTERLAAQNAAEIAKIAAHFKED